MAKLKLKFPNDFLFCYFYLKSQSKPEHIFFLILFRSVNSLLQAFVCTKLLRYYLLLSASFSNMRVSNEFFYYRFSDIKYYELFYEYSYLKVKLKKLNSFLYPFILKFYKYEFDKKKIFWFIFR